MTQEQRIEIYKKTAALLVNKSFHYQEMKLLAEVTDYLAQEIHASEQSKAADDNGPESEAPVL